MGNIEKISERTLTMQDVPLKKENKLACWQKCMQSRIKIGMFWWSEGGGLLCECEKRTKTETSNEHRCARMQVSILLCFPRERVTGGLCFGLVSSPRRGEKKKIQENKKRKGERRLMPSEQREVKLLPIQDQLSFTPSSFFLCSSIVLLLFFVCDAG